MGQRASSSSRYAKRVRVTVCADFYDPVLRSEGTEKCRHLCYNRLSIKTDSR
ncbi:hypothetical protein T07_12936 [Trichinella nelsoni]|uniref:Uncharacterized protein n=1 Tax=Trichinella nelsoni TaxID=6336 RepID=A0A0V0RCV6_9BILA|nr:hypothetical protein T07_12936 [Trichinella nelsoni]